MDMKLSHYWEYTRSSGDTKPDGNGWEMCDEFMTGTVRQIFGSGRI
jgi:hypothetical protein